MENMESIMEDYDYEYDEYEDSLLDVVPTLDTEENLQTVYENCVLPSVFSIVPNICDLILYNLMFSLMAKVGNRIPNLAFHTLTTVLGLALIWNVSDSVRLCIFISYLISSYAILTLSHKICRRVSYSSSNFTMVTLILSLLVCEFCFPYPKIWLQTRGVIMILVMKVFSLAHDFEHIRRLPSVLEFLGYMCCPANCLFGPWISYNEYCSAITRPFRRNKGWLARILLCVMSALFFLVISNCWCDYFIPDNNKILRSFKMALTFRTSHYFVSYLSEFGMTIAGYRSDKSHPGKWGYQITDPTKIEFPSSLVSVVTNWNIPMHVFLKKYVYRKVLPRGQFTSILATYFVSSLLHGFNIEIAVVLLTIGVFSYVQIRFQEKLSTDLNACIQIRPCRNHCTHKYKKGSFFVTILHVVFGVLTVVHLAYLGMLMDAIDNPDSPTIIEKWESLKYFSHLFLFFCYLYSCS